MIKIIIICGTRPNFMKIAPLIKVFEKKSSFETLLVHTGQHYDENMSKQFFDELMIPRPDINLKVGSASHAVQTAKIMMRFEPVVIDFKPDFVLVTGDVNSTIACSLVAAKMGVKLIHVEAGQRSFDMSMPEEINRILTDSISDLLFVSEPSGLENLKREGIPQEKIHYAGNIMIDSLLANRKKARNSEILNRLQLSPEEYTVITLHRQSNVDDLKTFELILNALDKIQKENKLVFPIHPRTRKNIEQTELLNRINNMKNLLLIDPLGYLDFLFLMENATLVMTDSGGIQEETTFLGTPCMTLRENTEWPITITEGSNHLVKLTTGDIVSTYHKIRNEETRKSYGIPKLWDGKAAERIISIIQQYKGAQ